MKKCLRKKCQKEFEPNKPKQVFCSAKCRVYFSREENKEKSTLLKVSSKGELYINPLAGKTVTVKVNKENKSDAPDPKDKIAYLQWLRKNG